MLDFLCFSLALLFAFALGLRTSEAITRAHWRMYYRDKFLRRTRRLRSSCVPAPPHITVSRDAIRVRSHNHTTHFPRPRKG